MHAVIPQLKPARRPSTAAAALPSTRDPHYECAETAEAMQLTIYVPGVEAAGIELVQRGTDLEVTARKTHFVRVNWQALHLERAQRDYHLRLRLGHGFDFECLHAELTDGVLTVHLPKRSLSGGQLRRPLRRAA